MSPRSLFAAASLLGVLGLPAIASAQTCAAVDEVAHRCLIDPTVASTTVRAAATGVGSGATQIVAAARYLGGISYFQSEFYFFQAFNPATFNFANPLANPNTLLGGKPEGSSIIDPPGPWISLPGVYSATQELLFGIHVRTSDLAASPTYTSDWYFTGFGDTRNYPGRYSQNGDFDYGFANLFLGGTAPVGDQMLASGLRVPSPAGWTNPWASGNGYFDFGSAKAILGFEDNRGYSDGDFNDAVIALDFRTVVPEPSSVALLALGLGATAAYARRKRKA